MHSGCTPTSGSFLPPGCQALPSKSEVQAWDALGVSGEQDIVLTALHPLSRTLTDLLKQPGHSPSENMDSLMAGVQVPLGEGLARGPPRNSTGKELVWWGK